MNPGRIKSLAKLFIITGAALGLVLLTLGLLAGVVSPAQAMPRIDPEAGTPRVSVPPGRPLRQSLSITQSATTRASADGSTIFNGDWITYTMLIRRDSGLTMTNINVYNLIPPGALTNVDCEPAAYCTILTEEESVVIRTLTTTKLITLEKTVAVTWSFAVTTQFPLELKFWGQATCQSAGDSFSSQASLSYEYDGGSGFDFTSPPLETAVELAPPPQNGQFALSAAPVACTNDGPIAAAFDMDWGDFDNDGDLDLALAALGQGIFVYQNDNGKLNYLWDDDTHYAEGVRWADFDGNANGFLEMVVSGDWDSANSTLPDGTFYNYTGRNYLYRYNGTNAFSEYSDFDTNDGAWRAEVADYSGDGRPDLAMINHWGGCTVDLHTNNGSGAFSTKQCLFGPSYQPCCFGRLSATSAAWGDYDNNGRPDLAVAYRDRSGNRIIQVFVNSAGTFTESNAIPVDTNADIATLSVFDMAWGDYDGDGRLDLAAAFSPIVRPPAAGSGGGRVRIYRNTGAAFSQVFSLNTAAPIGAVDWADFNGDGRLELLVGEADANTMVYRFKDGLFLQVDSLQEVVSQGDVLAIRAVDYDNDGDLDLSFTNFQSDSWLFNNTAPYLRSRISGPIPQFDAGGVAWGDIGGGYPDLIYGASSYPTRVYLNDNDRTFSAAGTFPGFFNPPARTAIFGDADNDGDEDLLFGLTSGQNLLYRNSGGGSFPAMTGGFPDWSSQSSYNTYQMALADVDQDNVGRLDLIVGNNGPNTLFMNPALQLSSAAPDWKSSASGDTRSIALSYFNNDILPDFVAANYGQSPRVYINTGYHGFKVDTNITLPASNSRSMAWGDYDSDGDLDLAVGNYNQRIQLYQKQGSNLSLIWTAPLTRNTTGVAWGDWDQDGDLDLAVGNYGQRDQVYANLGSTTTQVKLSWLWEADVTYNTTGVAWGDYDGDGDLDLAISKEGGSQPNGFYENIYNSAAHLTTNFAPNIPLPQNPPYLNITRPGLPNTVFKRTAPLTDPANLTVPINFTVFEPSSSRQSGSNQAGHSVEVVKYEYSLNGGGDWFTAEVTPALSVVATSRQGQSYAVEWLAGEDMAMKNPNAPVSDNARFRISIVRKNTPSPAEAIFGPLQRVAASASSPSFRVRNTSCVWPENPSVTIEPSPPISAGTRIKLRGFIAEWDLQLQGITYSWDFGNVISKGEIMYHTFTVEGTYPVTLTVSQPGCPVTRFDYVTTDILVGALPFTPTAKIYLPLIMKGGVAAAAAPPLPGIVSLDFAPGAPGQITGLQGQLLYDRGVTRLEWEARPEPVLGYRVYRAKIGAETHRMLVELPSVITTYQDKTADCGFGYFVTAYNNRGESLPSTSSFYGPPCR
jgi:hypothetical protein